MRQVDLAGLVLLGCRVGSVYLVREVPQAQLDAVELLDSWDRLEVPDRLVLVDIPDPPAQLGFLELPVLLDSQVAQACPAVLDWLGLRVRKD